MDGVGICSSCHGHKNYDMRFAFSVLMKLTFLEVCEMDEGQVARISTLDHNVWLSFRIVSG
jgi:hypothetical protein